MELFTKKHLVSKEAEYYLPEEYQAPHDYTITIKQSTFTSSAGIDESNSGGYFVLWPKDLQQTTNSIWTYLKKRDEIEHLGVVVTDSNTAPLRRGTRGIGLSWCGFHALKNYIGTPDIYGRKFLVTKQSILDGLAAAAVVVMGEGIEQTPLAVICDISSVHFQNRPPTNEEIQGMRISIEEDVYAPLLTSVKWRKGGGGNHSS